MEHLEQYIYPIIMYHYFFCQRIQFSCEKWISAFSSRVTPPYPI